MSSPVNDIVLYDIDNDRLAEIAIAQTPRRIIILNNTGDTILWTFQTSSAITRLAVLQQGREEPLLIAGASPYLWAVNRNGKVVWQVLLTGMTNQPLLWLATGNFDPDFGDEILAITRNSLYIVFPHRRLVRKTPLPFVPRQVEIGNLNYDICQEIVISDFNRLIVYGGKGDILIDLPLTNFNPEINRGFDLYDFNSDRVEEIIAINQIQSQSPEGETINLLSCFSPSGNIIWQSQTIPGCLRTTRVLRGKIYVGGTDFNGKDYLIKIDRTGKILKTVNLYQSITTPILYSPVAKFNQNPIYLQDLYSIGNLLLVALGWRDGKETKITNLRLFSMALDEINLVSPEYLSNFGVVFSDRNQTILDLCIGSVNGDTLIDILVARARAKSSYAIDCLINRSELIARAEKERWNNFRSALFLRNRSLAARCRRQAQILAQSLGNISSAVRTESLIRQEWRNYLKSIFGRTIFWTSVVFLAIGGFSFFVVRPIVKRRTHRLAQVEAKPIPAIVRLATELVALNHNYIVKGNWQGAYNRLSEIINSYGLKADRDLSLIFQKKTAESLFFSSTKPVNFQIHYRHFIKRLTNEPRTANLTDLVKKICYNVLGSKSKICELTLNRNEYTPKQISEGKITEARNLVVSFVYLINRDFPDIYSKARFYWDTRLYNWLEHLCTDHLRYAKRYTHFVFDYESATEWNRKLVLHLLSDASEEIDFDRKDSHLLQEWKDLKSDYQDYIQLPENAQALYYPKEKIWVKILDLISILKSIILPLGTDIGGFNARKDIAGNFSD